MNFTVSGCIAALTVLREMYHNALFSVFCKEMKVEKEIEEKWANKGRLDQKDQKVFIAVCWLVLVYEYHCTTVLVYKISDV